MQAVQNRIEIGYPTIITFENEEVKSVDSETAVSLVGEELFIDQLVPILNYTVYIREIFHPTDYTGFKSQDGKMLCGHYNEDLRSLPYGTVVRYYAGNSLMGKFYIKNVERTGRSEYKLNCISAVGLLDRQIHKGDVYLGKTVEDLLAEIIGNQIPYTIDNAVKTLKVYGHLPYSTKRKNLYQLVMALGINILRNNDGDMFFTFLNDTTVGTIPDSRVFAGGSVTYDEPASRVEVVEHGFYYNKNVPEEVLFDNTTGDYVSGALITFDKPIYKDSIRVEDGGNMTITSKGVNYCYATGIGVIVGIPYVHTTKVVSKDNPNAVNDKVVSVEAATLVTVTNSDNVLDRLAEFYFNATHFVNDIKLEGESCGKCYTLSNAFRESKKGFISKMSSKVTSFRRATCEVIEGYTPVGAGNVFENRTLLDSASGTWNIPSSVLAKEKPIIRVILIGKGSAGSNGEDGEGGGPAEEYKASVGGSGGKGGLAGLGGKIFSQTVDCTGLTSFNYGRDAAGNEYFQSGSISLSSEDGITSSTGFYDQLSGDTYAEPGIDGVDGAAGGKGGRNVPRGVETQPEPGEDLTYENTTYYGGAAGTPGVYNGSEIGVSDAMEVYCSGGGGGGAAVGNNGGDGNGIIRPVPSGFNGVDKGGDGANGADGAAASSVYGSGGNGGHGGGGGGGAGMISYFIYGTITDKTGMWPGDGGAGGNGSDGTDGCIIIYY